MTGWQPGLSSAEPFTVNEAPRAEQLAALPVPCCVYLEGLGSVASSWYGSLAIVPAVIGTHDASESVSQAGRQKSFRASPLWVHPAHPYSQYEGALRPSARRGAR